MESKTCTKCGEHKSKELFARKAACKDGYRSVCKECHNSYYRNYWQNTDAYDKHRERVRQNKAKVALDTRMKASGISESEYWQLRKAGMCQCCFKIRPLIFDHCHETGKFRGWLCMSCNTAIGKMGDNSSGVMLAYDYLIKFETKQ